MQGQQKKILIVLLSLVLFGFITTVSLPLVEAAPPPAPACNFGGGSEKFTFMVYKKDNTGPYPSTGTWTPGDAGMNYREGDWVAYQICIDNPASLTTEIIDYDFFDTGILVDGFSNFRYSTTTSLPDGTAFPEQSDTTNWPTFTPAIVNGKWDRTTCIPPSSGSWDAVNTPSAAHCVKIDFSPALTADTTLYYELHLAKTATWGTGNEANLDAVGPHEVQAPTEANPAGIEYGTGDWTGWTLSAGGAAAYPGSSGHARLVPAAKTVPIPIPPEPQGASLTLDKIVTNDNGGTAVESDWTLTATGSSATLTGPGAVGSTDVVSGAGFPAGTYVLSESAGPAGYTASAWSCTGGTQSGSSITLANGESATCTITNTDNKPTLTLVKTVITDDGG